MHIELTKTKPWKGDKIKSRWYWRLVSSNGQTILTSQRYKTKWNAKRAAWKLANENGYELRVVS